MKKMFISILLCILSSAYAVTTIKKYKQTGNICFEVRTSVSAESSKVSYGTGFVVDAKKGLLITNYHVVSDKIQNADRGLKNYVNILGKYVEAHIVDVDVIHDLALIHVDNIFDSEISKEISDAGVRDDVYAFGIPEDLKLSMVNAVHNGIESAGPFSRVLLSSPINPGMSGGPVVDNRSRLVGVNESKLVSADSISFAVPAKFAVELIKKNKNFDAKTFVEKKPEELHKNIHQQLTSAQEIIFAELEKIKKNSVINNWSIPSFEPYMKCWMTPVNDGLQDDLRKVRAYVKRCDSSMNAYISSHEDFLTTLGYGVNITTASNLKLNYLQFLNYANHYLFNHARTAITDRYVDSSEKRAHSRFICKNASLVNKNLISMQVEFCAAKYFPYTDIYNSSFKIIAFSKDYQNALTVVFDLDGFTADNAQKFIKNFVDGIKYEL